jgi:hypothetical protein
LRIASGDDLGNRLVILDAGNVPYRNAADRQGFDLVSGDALEALLRGHRVAP